MIEAVKEVVVHMLHTKEGSRVAMTTLWHGTAKVPFLLHDSRAIEYSLSLSLSLVG